MTVPVWRFGRVRWWSGRSRGNRRRCGAGYGEPAGRRRWRGAGGGGVRGHGAARGGQDTIAAAYARARVSEGWGLVGWVNAETRDVLLDGLARVAERAGGR